MDPDTSFLVDLLCEQARPRPDRATLDIAYPDNRFPFVYGLVLATMERAGQRIGAMDLLIATAAALVDAAPVVTRNVQDFSRVPGLEMVTY